MHIFMYVPVADCIAPASARNRIGTLSKRSTGNGGPGRARGCHWERRGSTFLCITSAIRVEAAELGSLADQSVLPSELRLGCGNAAH